MGHSYYEYYKDYDLCRYGLIHLCISNVNTIKGAQWNDCLMNTFGSRKQGIFPCGTEIWIWLKTCLKLKTLAFARRKFRKALWQLLGMICHETQMYFPFQNFATLFYGHQPMMPNKCLSFIIKSLCFIVLLFQKCDILIHRSELGKCGGWKGGESLVVSKVEVHVCINSPSIPQLSPRQKQKQNLGIFFHFQFLVRKHTLFI